ncbi:hypothetical protein EG329_004225 [Mollisiaceae sp. DMI_Dod_QoI]|nr:hypothetical protein EG329_004225 [Helotiales sp. DMI_Dod_QoI]
MVIVSLVAAGVGLALDAYTERRTRREDRRRNLDLPDEQIEEEIRTVSQEEEQRRREQEAFNELQNYADFQNVLSNKVLNDLSGEDVSMIYDAPPPPRKRTLDYGLQRMAPAQRVRSGQLQWPIIIPQRDPQNGDSTWVRAYPQTLMECGIDQQEFLSILDSFDFHMKLSTCVEAVNIASSSSGIGWRDIPETFSTAIPAAVQVMKAYQTDRKSDFFLNHVNALTFRPRGLFAMIITSRSDSPLQVITVDIPSRNSSHHFAVDVQMSTKDDSSAQQGESSAAATLSAIPSAPSSNQLESNGMGVDFTQRRRYFQESNQIPRMYSPNPNVESVVDLGSLTGRSPFSSLLSSVAKHRDRKAEAINRRIRKDRRPSSRANTSLVAALESASSTRPMGRRDVKPRRENINIDEGALYLVIVNDTPDDMSNPGGAMRFAPPNPIYQYPTAGNEEHNYKELVQIATVNMTEQLPPAATTSRPLDQFELFPNFPKELRSKIWGFAASEPRIIQIVGFHKGDGDGDYVNQGEHTSYGVARRSLKVPAVLHASSESRAEAKRFYRACLWEETVVGGSYTYTWINDNVDIILFGGSCCYKTITKFFEQEGPFQRVAVMIPEEDLRNCEEPDRIIKALHGSHPHNAVFHDNDFGNGCADLEDVYIIQRADVWDIPNHRIDANITFRPAVLNGRNLAATERKALFEDVVRRAQAGQGLFTGYVNQVHVDLPEDKWIDDKLPNFHWVNLARKRTANWPYLFDTMTASRYSYDLILGSFRQQELEEFKQRTGCSLSVQTIATWGSKAEIGLWGDYDAMENGKTHLRAMLRACITIGVQELKARRKERLAEERLAGGNVGDGAGDQAGENVGGGTGHRAGGNVSAITKDFAAIDVSNDEE